MTGIGAGLGDRDVHDHDIGLRRCLGGAQLAEHRGRRGLTVIIDLDVRVRLFERLNDRLRVAILEQGIVGDERHRGLGLSGDRGECQNQAGREKRYGAQCHCPSSLR
jgi:hypothetical protein